jgi:hypothetical protein
MDCCTIGSGITRRVGEKLTRVLGSLRSRVLTPSFSETTLEKRRFHVKDTASKHLLERVGRTFLTGFSDAVGADHLETVESHLEDITVRFRGFAYEGAAMGFAVADGVSLRDRNRFSRFLAGPGRRHVYMTQIGLGWALARLPRLRWPEPTSEPLLHWLVLDGYGFHEMYFHTNRVLARGAPLAPLRWGDPAYGWYQARAMDQGIGRALWFAGGTEPDVVADLIERFAPQRRPDLFSGAGLAATYAGGAGAAELERFRQRAGAHLPQVAQGCCFAAEARRLAGLEIEETDVATKVFCGLSARDAAQVAVESRPGSALQGDVPAYEVWRRRVADQFVSLRRT